MSLFRRKEKILPSIDIDDEMGRPAYGGQPATDLGIPIGVYAGKVPNPHILYGQDDMETGPVTFARYNMARGMHDVQLSNGWQYTGYGRICNYRNEGYLAVVQPEIPGQSRLFGSYGPPAGFVPRGNSPGQWQNIVNQAGQAPSNPGGPGQYMGKIVATGAGG
jgi:hypothetical protein